MIPEVVVAMLACARIGAPHNVVFGGFSAESVKERMEFSNAKALVTVDGARRKGKTAPIKQAVDEVMGDLADLETIFVVKHTGEDAEMKDGRDVWYHDALEAADDECEAEALDAEHPLYILYSSGSTAKPKGILHTTGGYLTHVAWTHKHVFDLKPDEDVWWCSADVGWVTGHSYIVYGPLHERRHVGDVRGRARTTPTRTSGGSCATATASRSSTPRRRRSAPASSGARSTPSATTCPSCACWARWASPSTPRRGCGTGRSSAAGAARSSTPGGRPRPAGS